jgi:rare lipoprotein A
MADNLSAVQNRVELRNSVSSLDSKSNSRMGVAAKLALTAVGCVGLASCVTTADNGGYQYKYKESAKTGTIVVAYVPPPRPDIIQTASAAPVSPVATPGVRGNNGTDKPYITAGKRYVPRSEPGYTAVGLASWYGPGFHGRMTADGERFDQLGLTAAHKTMPLPSYARVTNMANGASIVVRVNDRGPYVHDRLIDVSSRTAELLQFKGHGVGKVKVEYVGRAPDTATDSRMLLATLRTDGTPAPLPIGAPATMFAEAAPPIPPTIVPVQPDDVMAQQAPIPRIAPVPQFVQPVVAQAKVPAAAPVVAQLATPIPQVVAVNIPAPPLRPRSSDGVLGKVSNGSVGQARPVKAIVPLPPIAPDPQPQPNADTAVASTPVLMPTHSVNASMGQ